MSSATDSTYYLSITSWSEVNSDLGDVHLISDTGKIILYRCVSKIAKASDSFFMSVSPYVRLPVCMEQLGFHWTDFHEI